MIRYIVFFAAFLASAVAVGAVSKETVKTANCCMPNQWSANLTILNTVGKYSTILEAQMDFGRNQQVYKNYTLGSKTPSNTVLVDYGQGHVYYLLANDSADCYKKDVHLSILQCIPEDAQVVSSGYMGPEGSGRMPIDTWQFQARYSGNVSAGSNVPNVTMGYTLTVTKSNGSCVPLVERIHFSDGTPDQDYLITEFKTYLTDPSLFTLPESCQTPISMP